MKLSAGSRWFGVLIGVIIVLYAGWELIRGPSPRYCEKPYTQRDHQVVMFSTVWCPYCKRARQFFNEHQVPYCEYDAEGSQANQQAFYELGGDGVPLILIGEEVFYGFHQPSLEQEIKRQELFIHNRVN